MLVTSAVRMCAGSRLGLCAAAEMVSETDFCSVAKFSERWRLLGRCAEVAEWMVA